jgi:hypothetical protein
MTEAEIRALTAHIVDAVDRAEASTEPFNHIVIDGVFPNDVYARMLALMPKSDTFRALRGHKNFNVRADGTSTRIKLDLFPEYIRHLPKEAQGVWAAVGRALRSREVRDAFVRRLAPGLKRRFGESYENVGLYPIPMLTRDTVGYRIAPHTDTRWKGITVQLYLPPDESIRHVGTGFDAREGNDFRRVKQMQFKPNHGYAFAVGDNTWHSVDACGELPISRDSILHTYFVDQSPLHILRNRGKRIGNFIQNEVRQVF